MIKIINSTCITNLLTFLFLIDSPLSVFVLWDLLMKIVHTLLRRTLGSWWMRIWHVVSNSSLQQRGPTVSWYVLGSVLSAGQGRHQLNLSITKCSWYIWGKNDEGLSINVWRVLSYCYPFNRLNCRNDQLSVCDSKYPEVTDSCVRSSKLIAPQ